jgi:hypothetical protein
MILLLACQNGWQAKKQAGSPFAETGEDAYPPKLSQRLVSQLAQPGFQSLAFHWLKRMNFAIVLVLAQ